MSDEPRDIAHQRIISDLGDLKLWLRVALLETVFLFSVGLYTYHFRNTLSGNAYIMSIAGHFPGPSRMERFMYENGRAAQVSAALYNVFFCLSIHTGVLIAILFFSVKKYMMYNKKIDKNPFSILLLLLSLFCSIIPIMAPFHPDSRSERINTMALGDLAGGYLAYPIMLSLATGLLVMVLWARGELRS